MSGVGESRAPIPSVTKAYHLYSMRKDGDRSFVSASKFHRNSMRNWEFHPLRLSQYLLESNLLKSRFLVRELTDIRSTVQLAG